MKKANLVVWFLIIVFISSIVLIFRFESERKILGDAIQRILPTGFPFYSPAIAPSGVEFFRVVKIADGDTFSVIIGNDRKSVRMIGINTPESVDPRRPVECFGKEASEYAKKILQNKSVRLEADPSQQNRDRYGRILRYAYTDDGVFFNLKMIADGYAYEYTYDTPYVYQKQFKTAEKKAREEKRGLWNPQTCNGST